MIGQSVSSMQSGMINQKGAADSKQVLADKLFASAEAHEKSGDTVRAQQDRAAAEKAQIDADNARNQASAYDVQIALRKHEANSIDREIDQIRKQADSQITALEAKKHSILG